MEEYIYQLKQTIETDEVKIAKYEALNKEKNDECVQNASPRANPVQPTELAGEVMQLKQELEKAKRLHPPKGPRHTLDSSTHASYYSRETEDSMLAAEVLAETVLEVKGDGHQSLSWSGHGFRLTVPAGAVPTGATISVAIKSILSGEFKLPDSCQLASTIYWIKTSQPFNKNVILHLHHCGVIKSKEQCSQYKFVAGRCSQPDRPYKLVPRDGGVFTQHTHEASISVKQFSFYAIAGDEDSELFYIGQAFYRPVEEVYAWQFDYVITKDAPSLVEDVRKEYEKGGWSKHHDQLLEFEETEDESEQSITLSIEQGSQDDKWEIKPITPNQITKRKVDRMSRKTNHPHSLLPPHCLMAVEWKGELRHRFPVVSRRVELEGARHPDNYFSIQLPERATISSASVPTVPVLPEGDAPDGILDEDDLEEVVTELKDINDVEELGLRLGLRMSVLESIMADYRLLEKQKTKVIYHWLKRKDVVRRKQNELPTWKALAEAVANLDPSSSERIHDKYC